MSVENELGTKAKRMLADFRSEHSPPATAADAMLAGIQARLAEPPPADPGPGTASRLARLRGWVVVGGLVIGGTLAGVAARGDDATIEVAETSDAHATVPEEPAPAIAPPPSVAPTPTPVPPQALAPTPAPVDTKPDSGPRRATPRRASPEPAAAPGPSETAAALKEELALLRRAQQALAREDGAAARAALDEHEQRFADGKLAGEREATRILVVCAEDPIRGRSGLDRYLSSHPRSPYAERLRTSCGAKDSDATALDTGDASH